MDEERIHEEVAHEKLVPRLAELRDAASEAVLWEDHAKLVQVAKAFTSITATKRAIAETGVGHLLANNTVWAKGGDAAVSFAKKALTDWKEKVKHTYYDRRSTTAGRRPLTAMKAKVYMNYVNDFVAKPDKVNSQEGADSETFVMGSDAAEFVNKVKDQVRSRQKRMSNVADSGEEHSIIWGMFMAATMNAATFMGKNFSTIQNFIMNSEDLTLKQMFDITAKLVSDQDEINGLDNIHWGKNSWRQLSLIGDETVINLQRTKVYVFSDSVLCFGKILQHPESNEAWKNRIAGVMSEKSYRDYDGINGEPTEFEWNIFPGFTTLQLCGKVNDLLSNLGETPETFTGRILFMSMFNDTSCDRKRQ